ncbi:MAG: flavodoxin [Methanomicrobiales archaeon]|nr:flavodoxin [Methanomicrobiales archaeon]
MPDVILVAYATRYGSTVGLADAIGGELKKTGVEVDVQPVSEVRDISRYRAVIVGSPIYMGKWLPEAQVFIERNQQHLRGIPVAFFAVGLTVAGGAPDAAGKAEASMDQVRMLVNPMDTAVFPGRLESRRLSVADRAITRLIRAKTGDFRDLGAARTWARALCAKIDPA